jgi:acetyl-CoA synthetase
MENFKKKNNDFWLKNSELVKWYKRPNKAVIKKNNKFIWYPDAKLNVYYNCITANIESGLNKKIALYVVNNKKQVKTYTYENLDYKISIFLNWLEFNRVNTSSTKTKAMIHTSSSLESAVSMLGFAKIGFHFSVIFEDLEDEAIIKRVLLFKPKVFITRFKRNDFVKKYIKLYKVLKKQKIKVLFFSNFLKTKQNKKKKFHTKFFSSNKNLFTLFTSGSTGEPKGVTHSTGGYFLYTKFTCQNQFGMNKESIVLTASDAGWINGHTYALFGPLSFGSTSILLEKPISILDLELLKRILNLKVSILYLPVTLIRLMRSIFGNSIIKSRYLITLGSMGEPLAQSIAKWFSKTFSNKNKSIVNTYFQTETGGIIASPRYNQKIMSAPHGSVGSLASNFIKINNLSSKISKEIKIVTPWPGCMKSIINGKKVWNKYWDTNGNFRLFDLAITKKKNIYIFGRMDDVINIRGHRIGSGELEAIVLKSKKVSECSAISINDEIEGNQFILFIVPKMFSDNLKYEIEKLIKLNFGTFAIPKKIISLNMLPKTRSGKILRRLLRDISLDPYKKTYGDLSTILDKDVVVEIKKKLID